MSAVGAMLKRRKTTAEDIPGEIVRKEILTRVPIKDVVRFKSVSKTWLSLFSDPQFVKDHLTRCSTQAPNDYDCLVAQYLHGRIVLLSRYQETSVHPCPYFSMLGSVRGLVCLRKHHKLALWNPAIHQFKAFTLPTQCSLDCKVKFGFGFDSLTNDYKVVVWSSNLRPATVYLSNSDSWIHVSVPDLAILEDRLNTYVIVKDCPYWIFSKYTDFCIFPEDRHANIIKPTAVSFIPLKFDVGSNEFKLLPEFYLNLSSRGAKFVFGHEFVDMNDCLTLMVYDRRRASKSAVEFYSLNGEDGCCVWSKIYSIGPIGFHTQKPYVTLSQGFKYGSEIVYHDDKMFSCYDHKTYTTKHLVAAADCTTCSMIRCFRYTPCLVFLEGMKSVHSTTQTHRQPGLCFRPLSDNQFINRLITCSGHSAV